MTSDGAEIEHAEQLIPPDSQIETQDLLDKASEQDIESIVCSPDDVEHLRRLATRYVRSCTIHAAEDRAIRFDQLAAVLTFALTNCHRWQDLSTNNTQPLTSYGLDHYDMVKWVLQPAASASSCSFVELVADGAQEPEYYLTHYFGQPAQDILECVRQHLRTKRFPDDTTYWVWAYAHRFGHEDILPDKLHSSPASRAMNKASGILLALGTTSVPFSRTWCLIEITLAVLDARKPLDVAASAQGVKILTEQLTEVERRVEHKIPGSGFREKSHREQSFPAEMLLAAIDIGLERSDAASKMDRNRILYKFLEEKGVEIGSVPLHRLLEKVNIKLRSIFACMMWLPLLDTDSGKAPRTRAALADCIRANVSKDLLELSFCFSRMDDPHMAALARAMHKNLAKIDLNFCMCAQITAKGVEEVAKSLPAKLRTLRLNFKLCSGIGQGGVDALSNSLPPSLTSLHLNFSCNSEIRSLASLCRGIRNVHSLKFLELDLSAVEYLNDKSLVALAEMFNDLGSLKNLLMSFKGCKSISDAGVVAVLEGLPSVSLLKLDFGFCNVSDSCVEVLANRMQGMLEAVVMHISFQGCQDITVPAVAHLVQILPATLKGAKINVFDTPLPKYVQSQCRRLASIRAWAQTMQPVSAWTPPARIQPALEPSNDKPGISLRSLDLVVHNGRVQDSRPASQTVGHRPPWQEKMNSEEEHRISRTFSAPFRRDFKALLPKVAHKSYSVTSMAHAECMFSRPRTTHLGFSEPVWYP